MRAVKDRVVQAALTWVIESIFETSLRQGALAFDGVWVAKDALREVDRYRYVKLGYC